MRFKKLNLSNLLKIVLTVCLFSFIGVVGLFLNHKINLLSEKNDIEVELLEKNFERLSPTVKANSQINQLVKKVSIKDSIWHLSNAKFYVPNYPFDDIQNNIVEKYDFHKGTILRKTNKYLPNNAVILDLGANIGNHTIYWGIINKVKKIYAYEPLQEAYDILVKNVEVNNLKNKVSTFNIGLTDKKTKGVINFYPTGNLGGTTFNEDEYGNIEFNSLDNLNFLEKVDFLKIDVNGFEVKVINGAKNLLKKHTPTILLHVYSDSAFEKIVKIFEEIGYKKDPEFAPQSGHYVFIPQETKVSGNTETNES